MDLGHSSLYRLTFLSFEFKKEQQEQKRKEEERFVY